MFSARISVSVFALLAVASAEAQSTSRDLDVPEITVMGQTTKTSPMDYAPTVSELSGQRLRRRQQSTLGETLSRETGVNSSQFGPNASRPVIRGLDGERIRILQNGTGVLDASAASQDHAVAIDPLVIDRIEIVRGPAALLYGPSAVGGVVNIVNRRIAETMPKLFDGRFDSRYSTVDQGRSGSVAADVGLLGNWAFHVDGSLRASDNYKVPDFARTAEVRAADPRPEEDFREVTNSFNQAWNGALGGSYIAGTKGFLGASYARYGSEYGTVAEKSVSIHMKQQRVDIAGGLRDLGWIESMKVKTALSEYQHEEIEAGQVGTTFKNRGNESRLEFKHQRTGDFDGLFGLQANVFRFEALGDERFLPATNNQTYSAFLFEEATYGAFKPSAGLRGDFTTVASEDDPGKFGPGADKRFEGVSGSLGVVYTIDPVYSLALSSSYTERAPNYQELFADGQHIATRVYERGDRNLTKEKSRAVGLSIRRKEAGGSGSVGAFLQSFDGFIALSPTGQTDGSPENLPIYEYQSVQANLYGAEAEYKHQFAGVLGGVVELEAKLDYVKSRNDRTGASLPRIPPIRETLGLAYQTDRLRADIEVQRSEQQSDLAAFETQTPAYTWLNLGIEAPIEWDDTVLNLFARANNIFDAEARNHVSILKDIAPHPGRNFTFGLQARF